MPRDYRAADMHPDLMAAPIRGHVCGSARHI